MQTLGKYQLIRKIATGGMAEVFLAKAAGPMGFEKTLVVKRILPHLAEDESFVQMFLGEAKLAAQLNHPNVVQIFDFGESDGAYFIAMEHIDGPNLRGLSKSAVRLGRPIPLTLCAKTVSFAAEGLAFAHDFADPATGAPLGLIHRDISPDNILVGRNGAVKVVDFGIAKAAGQSHHTQTGILKGKLSYMPPEQLEQKPLDRRIDVFALGMVLYELVCGHKPFDGTTDASIMHSILFEPLLPAATHRPDVPPELQAILDRALAKDRDARYPSCRELQLDLERFVLAGGEPVGAFHLATLVRELGPASSAPSSTPAVGSDVRTFTGPASQPEVTAPSPSIAATFVPRAPSDEPPQAAVTTAVRTRSAELTAPTDVRSPGALSEAAAGAEPGGLDAATEQLPKDLVLPSPFLPTPKAPVRLEGPPSSLPTTSLRPHREQTLVEAVPTATSAWPEAEAPSPASGSRRIVIAAAACVALLAVAGGAYVAFGSPESVPQPRSPAAAAAVAATAPHDAVAAAESQRQTPARAADDHAAPAPSVPHEQVAVPARAGETKPPAPAPTAPHEAAAVTARADETKPPPAEHEAAPASEVAKSPEPAAAEPASTTAATSTAPVPDEAHAPDSDREEPVALRAAEKSASNHARVSARFRIETTPAASVKVNGKVLGRSPVTAIGIAPGPVRIEISDPHAGFRKEERFVARAGDNGTRRIVVATATIEFRVRPYATVTLDDRSLGQTPFAAVTAYEGPHEIHLVNHALNKDVTVRFDVKPGANVFKYNLTE